MSRVAGLSGNIWPDQKDSLLLRFLLHSDSEEAAGAWRLWRPEWDPDAPTAEQYRLYPLMAERVATFVPDESKLGMLQGVRLQGTIQNLLILDRLDEVLSGLQRSGIEGVVLKGAALALSVYDHVGQRPFHDLDVFVDPRQHAQALSSLLERGWVQREPDFVGNQAVMLDRAGVSLDLHRKHNRELVITGSPTSAWDNIQTVRARRPLRSGRSVRILAPADGLVQVVVHGTQTEANGVPFRWVVDAQRLILSGAVDWARVAELARLFEVGPIVHDSLVFLRDVTGVVLPADILLLLKAGQVRAFSRRRLAAFHEAPNTQTVLGGLPGTIRRGFQYTLDQPWLTALLAAPGFFSVAYRVRRPRELPLELARRAWRRRGRRQHSGAAVTS
jgi:hypothetical protein